MKAGELQMLLDLLNRYNEVYGDYNVAQLKGKVLRAHKISVANAADEVRQKIETIRKRGGPIRVREWNAKV